MSNFFWFNCSDDWINTKAGEKTPYWKDYEIAKWQENDMNDRLYWINLENKPFEIKDIAFAYKTQNLMRII